MPVNGSVPLVAVVPRTPVAGDFDAFEAGETADFAGDAFAVFAFAGAEECVAPCTPLVAGATAGVLEAGVLEAGVLEAGVLDAGVLLAGVTVAGAAGAGVDVCAVPQLEELAGMLAFVGHGWQLPLFAAIELSYEHGWQLELEAAIEWSYEHGWQLELDAGIEWS